MTVSVLALAGALLSGCPAKTPGPTDGGAAAAAPAAAPPAAAVSPQVEKAAEAVITDSCAACHEAQLLRQQRLTVAQWTAVIDKMKKWGAPLEPAQKVSLLAFTSARYTTGAGPHRAAALPAADVDGQLAPQPDGTFASGNAQAGATLFMQACATCHGKDGTGTELGLNLIDRPVIFRAAEFAAVVRTGRGRMPALPTTDEQIGGLLAHLRAVTLAHPDSGEAAPSPR